MATKIYDVIDVELQNGQTVTVKPLPVARLRKFMAVMSNWDKLLVSAIEKRQDEDFDELSNSIKQIDILVDACKIALAKVLEPEQLEKEELEELLDFPTMMKIVEVAGGINMNSDPNLLAEAASAGLN